MVEELDNLEDMGYTASCREETIVRKKILDHKVSDTGLSVLYFVQEGIFFKHYLVFMGYTEKHKTRVFITTRQKDTAFTMYNLLAKDMD